MPRDLPIYQVDAFADALFGGNPAAVMPLDAWLPDALMQVIAAENNLAETAFLVAEAAGYRIRWFTPTVEIALCGHATLAAAAIVFSVLRPGTAKIRFSTETAGELVVTKDADLLALDFPCRKPEPVPVPAGLAAAVGREPDSCVAAADNLYCVFPDAAAVAGLAPDFAALARLPYHGVAVTAPGEAGVDFVSRYFAPAVGIDEDPVTGSTHCALIPYWAGRLGRASLTARQISPRGGTLFCHHHGERVSIAGRTQLYMTGTVHLP